MMQTVRPTTLLRRAIITMSAIVGVSATLMLLLAAKPAGAAQAAADVKLDPQLAGWAFMAAAISTALGALGAGYAVGRVGSAAVGAIAEKPELLGRLLVLVGLAEGIAIYGLIVSVLILNRLG
jgi:V/A-type H+/Na+-transporting ATPase subunit K